jgi:geranylgeranyl diphosphate synthase type I
MDWLKSLYPEIRNVLRNITPDYWPGLKAVIGGLFEEPIATEAVLPLASCRAVGGDPRDAVHVTAALIMVAASLRLYDDIEDQDRPGELWEEVGYARAWNYASAVHILSFDILSKAPLSHDRFRMINQLFIDGFFNVTAGQDRDLAGVTKTVEDYWLTIDLKIGCAYAVACMSGAMVGTDNSRLIESCRVFGHHLGLSKQILNDMESIWQPDGITDIKQGKITLPLVYGMSFDHPARDELKMMVQNNEVSANADRVKEILDKIEAKNFLLWAALKEREQALDALRACPDAEGKAVLEAYITGMFGDIDSLVEQR